VKLRRPWRCDVETGTTITGRRPDCSDPERGARSAQKTSPGSLLAPGQAPCCHTSKRHFFAVASWIVFP
jgi:hypothetical protein